MVALAHTVRSKLGVFARLVLYSSASVMIAAVLAVSVGPRILPYQSFVVLTASMAPQIPVGSVVMAVPVGRAELAVGDVVTYQRAEEPDLPVTHRIVAMRAVPGAIIARTKGDANDVQDPWEIQLGPTVLRVAFAVPLAGYILFFAQTFVGRVLTIGMPLVALAFIGIHEYRAARRLANAGTTATATAA